MEQGGHAPYVVVPGVDLAALDDLTVLYDLTTLYYRWIYED